MNYRKSILLLMLVICLFSITSVCASEIDNSIASEDTSQMGLSDSNKIIEDDLQTSEENTKLTVDENDETLNSEIDSEILTANQFTYSNLREQIGSGGNINLTKGTYTYNNGDGDTIQISTSGVINGNGAVIDMAQSGYRAFEVTTSDVTIKNLVIKNANYYGVGGAIYFEMFGSVENCNFTNNTASLGGGAISFWNPYKDMGSTVTNCNFIDNKAGDGGAVSSNEYGFTVTNCNFINNTATSGNAGAVLSERDGFTVTNCNFINNTASLGGGAIRTFECSVENCNFINNTASRSGGAIIFIHAGTVTNCKFTDNVALSGSGGAIYFGYCYEDTSKEVKNCNFTGNNAAIGSAIYYFNDSKTKTVSNSRFLNNRANVEDLQVTKNDNNITITFTGRDNLLNAIYSDDEVSFTNVTYWSANGIANTDSSSPVRSNREAGQNITVGIVVNYDLILNEVKVTDENGTIVLDISVGENYYISARHDTDSYYTETDRQISNMTVNVTSQTTNNKTVNITAKSNIYNEIMPGKLLFIVPTGENITANYVGNGTWWAVYEFADYGDYQVNATYVGLDNVTVNNGTISISKIPTEIIINSTSLDLFVGDEAVIVANLTPADAGNVTFTSSNESVVEVDVQGNVIAQGKGQAIITVSFAGNNKYAAAENRTINVTVSLNDASVTVDNNTLDLKAGETYAINATKHPDTIMLDITYTSSNSSVVTVDKKGIVTAVGVGTAVITVEVGDDEIYAKNSTNVTVTVSKVTTEIGAKPVTATYNVNKNLIITLKDANGNPVTGVSLSVDLNGAKTFTTDKNGQVKVSTKGLAPKTYTAKITFNGNAKYDKSSKNVKVTVKKAKPKIIAKKKKTYRANAKTKKLKITLKDKTGKPIKNAKVS